MVCEEALQRTLSANRERNRGVVRDYTDMQWQDVHSALKSSVILAKAQKHQAISNPPK